MDLTWARDEDDRTLIDYLALGVIVIAVLSSALLSLGALVAPFIVSRAYGEYNYIVSLSAAGIGALVAVYLLMTWVTVEKVHAAIALVVLLGGMSYLAVDRGIPATIGSVQGREGTVTFLVTRATNGGRRSCAGIHVANPDYVDGKICGIRAKAGTHVTLSGKVSWFGIAYKATRPTP